MEKTADSPSYKPCAFLMHRERRKARIIKERQAALCFLSAAGVSADPERMNRIEVLRRDKFWPWIGCMLQFNNAPRAERKFVCDQWKEEKNHESEWNQRGKKNTLWAPDTYGRSVAGLKRERWKKWCTPGIEKSCFREDLPLIFKYMGFKDQFYFSRVFCSVTKK